MRRQQYGRCGDLKSLDRLRGHPLFMSAHITVVVSTALEYLRGHPLFVSAHIRAGAVSGPECRRRSRGRVRRRQVPRWRDEGNGGRGRSEQRERGPFRALKMRPVRQELLLARHAPKDESGGQEAVHSLCGRLFCGSLKMRRVPQEPVFVTEYLFCTVGACFEHRVPLKTPSVQKKRVFMHRISLPYRKSLFCAPNIPSVP